MKLLRLTFNFLFEKKSQFVSSLLLIAFGYILISSVLQLNQQLENYAEKNLSSIDLVVGAEGSPLQLILSSVLHADYPTGNIDITEAQFLAKNRLIKKAIPLSLGDSYKGFRLVGSTEEIVDFYKVRMQEGHNFHHPFEAVVGSEVAQKLELKIGDTFYSNHGLNDDNMHTHDNQHFKVVGLAAPSGSVADYLIFTSYESIWILHEEHDHDNKEHGHETHAHEEHNHGEHTHEGHDHEEHHEHSHKKWFEHSDKQITSLLIQYKSPMAAVQLPRIINEKNNLQSASPIFEIKRLLKLIGFAVSFIEILALLIIAISALNIYLSIYQLINEKKFELMMIRVLGGSPIQLFAIPSLLGILLSVFGSFAGLVLSKLLLVVLGSNLEESYFLTMNFIEIYPFEMLLFLGIILVGLLSSALASINLLGFDPIKILKEK